MNPFPNSALAKAIAIAAFIAFPHCGASGGSLPANMKDIPPDQIEAALPDEHPAAFYVYAKRLFEEGRKDDAVFWFYVGQLRYRFYLRANPKLDPSGDPAVFSSLSATIGKGINEYAGGSVKGWMAAIDRALKWDAEHANGFTSKEKFAKIYEENREGLKQMREQLGTQRDFIREQRKKAGLENRD